MLLWIQKLFALQLYRQGKVNRCTATLPLPSCCKRVDSFACRSYAWPLLRCLEIAKLKAKRFWSLWSTGYWLKLSIPWVNYSKTRWKVLCCLISEFPMMILIHPNQRVRAFLDNQLWDLETFADTSPRDQKPVGTSHAWPCSPGNAWRSCPTVSERCKGMLKCFAVW